MKLFLRSELQVRLTDETTQAVAEHFDQPIFQFLINRRDFRREWVTAALLDNILPEKAYAGSGPIWAMLRLDADTVLSHVPLRALVTFADAAHVRIYLYGHPHAVISSDILLAVIGSRWHSDPNSRVICKLLIEQTRTPVSFRDMQTALADAAVVRSRRRPFLLRLLLERHLVVPPYVSLKDALRAATAEGNWIVRFILLEHGVDVDAVDGDGDTALRIARRVGHRWPANELIVRVAMS